MASPTASNQEAPSPSQAVVAGFWRRLAAFLVDRLLLGVVGWMIGSIFTTFVIGLGNWGRLLGFAIALIYFTVTESRAGSGRSVGKRVLKLRLCDGTGAPLSVVRTAARFSVFAVPYFLNGIALSGDADDGGTILLGRVLCFSVFGLGLSILYLLTFNRRTRQSLPDLMVGSWVVRADEGRAPGHAAMWPGHWGVVALVLAASLALPSAITSLTKDMPVQGLMSLQRAVAALPQVRSVGVFDGWTRTRSLNAGASQTRSLQVSALVRQRTAPNDALALQIASVALAAYPAAEQRDGILIVTAYGYDLGIASYSEASTSEGTPGQWHERIRARDAAPRQPAQATSP